MDQASFLAIDRLADIAVNHEMPAPMVKAFIGKCAPDIISGKTLCIWKSDIKGHVVMQSIIIDMDIKKENENEK